MAPRTRPAHRLARSSKNSEDRLVLQRLEAVQNELDQAMRAELVHLERLQLIDPPDVVPTNYTELNTLYDSKIKEAIESLQSEQKSLGPPEDPLQLGCDFTDLHWAATLCLPVMVWRTPHVVPTLYHCMLYM